ncbi:putative carboxyphosphonoenolpyruvate mutase [Cladophialophora carrionii]|uniref:Putative carboxyphosphonoenolpyruvate mutase n=1 Tax=Cladophialophora carrionii TaxID=86049 RepID=A0A1C1CKW7_9EURO|nr:putative carboxyphosphonoenolpyruvate mutase [Cladophialophora carrionii]
MASTHLNLGETAKTFRDLHRPGRPLVLANVYDMLSAKTVAGLSSCHALATASYSVALAAGTTDDELTLDQNMAAARQIGRVAAAHGKPLTVDLQDGYGDRLADAVRQVIAAGAVGINLEDYDRGAKAFYSVDEAAARVRTAVQVAAGDAPVAGGLRDFVVNARCDTLVQGGELAEVIERGKSYLDAGATSVFVWGGRQRGVSRAEVEQLVTAFDGRLSVSFKWEDGLTVAELAAMGVARISVGPAIMFFAMAEYERRARLLLDQAQY